jgi:hypothetical protein
LSGAGLAALWLVQSSAHGGLGSDASATPSETRSDRGQLKKLDDEVSILQRQVKYLIAKQQAGPLPLESAGPADKRLEDGQHAEEDSDSPQRSPEERRAHAYAAEAAFADTLVAATFGAQPLDRRRAGEAAAQVAEGFREIGAELTSVRCTSEVCQADVRYPETSEAAAMDRILGHSLCRDGECWVRRLPDRNEWQIYAAGAGRRLPNIGPVPTD